MYASEICKCMSDTWLAIESNATLWFQDGESDCLNGRLN